MGKLPEVESWEELLALEMASFDAVEEPVEDFGIEYEEWEELDCGGAKDRARDRHRWELDPASAEDFVDRHPGGRGPALRWRHFGH